MSEAETEWQLYVNRLKNDKADAMREMDWMTVAMSHLLRKLWRRSEELLRILLHSS